MIIHPCKQGTEEWLKLRAGIPTASEFDAILTPQLEPRKGQMVQTYLAKKLAEWWQGGPLPSYAPFGAMEQGQILETEAIPWYELEYSKTINRVGFITNDDVTVGCSPDGLIGEDCGIEIKCPFADTHVKYLLGGLIPPDYMPQVHGSLWVTGKPMWKFLSYRRHFPALLLTVERNESIMARIGEAVESFLEQFAAGKETMIELNGGTR